MKTPLFLLCLSAVAAAEPMILSVHGVAQPGPPLSPNASVDFDLFFDTETTDWDIAGTVSGLSFDGCTNCRDNMPLSASTVSSRPLVSDEEYQLFVRWPASADWLSGQLEIDTDQGLVGWRHGVPPLGHEIRGDWLIHDRSLRIVPEPSTLSLMISVLCTLWFRYVR